MNTFDRGYAESRMRACMDAARTSPHPDSIWLRFRTCDHCRDYHYRLLPMDGQPMMMWECCGRTIRPACPACGSSDLTIESMVNRAGVAMNRLRCACGRSRGDWFMTNPAKKRQPLAYIIRGRQHSCAACGIDLVANDGEVDHIVALCDGGPDILSNLQRLCVSCHDRKHAGRFR